MEFRSEVFFYCEKRIGNCYLYNCLPLNEEFLPVLKVMNVMGVTIGQTAREYADIVDNAQILSVEKTVGGNCKDTRMRRSLKDNEIDNFEETEGLLYAPGIAN
ncbi:hypothetical protein TNIN_293361 [Trichonephila inaurata madagascariensis]|uniref:Uncharacterized protein n=1 Tax=Trichonephila inaurata madagascariensis TaxID=2747483 RepID=A0A8X7C963_9ARAC|nr:hypothetical protein TNIN_293361 [Trichonephila inaurata madagascariensis]